MPSNDLFDDMILKLKQVLEYAVVPTPSLAHKHRFQIVTHDNTQDLKLENIAVHFFVCVKSFLNNYRRVHQWYESARLFMRTYDEDFPGIRAFALEYLSQDHDDLEELAAMLENAELGDEDELDEVINQDKQTVKVKTFKPKEVDGAGEPEYEAEEELDDLEFDRLMALFE